MFQLNLPTFNLQLRSTRTRPEIYDFLRRRYVKLTPEEWVRQHFVHWLIEEKGYPQGLLGNEIALQCGTKRLRCDTILYDRQLHPVAIIEYKAPTVALSQKVFDQIATYNILLHVDFLMVSNGLQHVCCRMDYANNRYVFLPDIPDYQGISLLKKV